MLMGPYNASKFAIEAIGESLRSELHPWGISVSVVEPGAVKTPLWDEAGGDRGFIAWSGRCRRRPGRGTPGTLRRPARLLRCRTGRARSPDKVAAAVEHALFSPRPKTRYLVGTDARVQALLVRWLPDRPREAIIRRFAGP